MSLEINNSSFIFNASRSRLVIDDPYSVGEIIRVFNSSSVSRNYSYTDLYGRTQSTNVSAGSTQYVLVKFGSVTDSYNAVTEIIETRLLIYDTVLGNSFTEQLLSAPGISSWTKPTGVTQVVVECWGGGGAGGGATDTLCAGGSGAGGQYVRSLVTYSSPSTNVSYQVATAVLGDATAGQNGQDTTWGSSVVVAKGGQGGAIGVNGAVANGGIASIENAIGTVVYKGGSGGIGAYVVRGDTAAGGNGGTGPGSVENGINDSAVDSAKEYGGSGGIEGLVVASGGQDGSPGQLYGAGGGGAAKISGANRSGGDGAQGLIRLIYR